MNRSNVQRYKRIKKGNYENPFFPKRRQAVAPSGRRGLLKVLIVVLLAGGVVAAQEHPYLQVKRIDVEGAHLIDEQLIREVAESAVQGRRFGLLRKDHLMLIPKQDIAQRVRDSFAVKEVDISRQWPDAIHIAVGEREPIMRLNYPPQHFSVIDADGIAVITEVGEKVRVAQQDAQFEGDQTTTDNNEANTLENTEIPSVVECNFCDTMGNLPLVYASSTPPAIFTPGVSLLSSERVTTLSRIFTRFIDLSIPIDFIVLDESIPGTAEIHVLEGFLVYIDLSKEINAQIANLSVLLQEKYPNAPRNLQYIDVRYGNRLYYQ